MLWVICSLQVTWRCVRMLNKCTGIICISQFNSLFCAKFCGSCCYSLGKVWLSQGPDKGLDLIQEVSVPRGPARNLLPCEVSSFQRNISSTVGSHWLGGSVFLYTQSVVHVVTYVTASWHCTSLTSVMPCWDAQLWLTTVGHTCRINQSKTDMREVSDQCLVCDDTCLNK